MGAELPGQQQNTSHTIYLEGRRHYCGYFRVVKD